MILLGLTVVVQKPLYHSNTVILNLCTSKLKITVLIEQNELSEKKTLVLSWWCSAFDVRVDSSQPPRRAVVS